MIASDFIITAEHDGKLYVWQGRYGWREVPKDTHPHYINSGYRYVTRQRADATIRRMQNKYPCRLFWRSAKYLTIDEAQENDNVLGLKWA